MNRHRDASALDEASAWRKLDPNAIPSTLITPDEFRVAIQKANNVFDVGCGTGSTAALWRGRKGSWLGIDVNRAAVDAANRNKTGNAAFVVHDGRRPLKVDVRYDLLLFKAVLTCMPTRMEQVEILRNALECATPRRFIAIADFLQDWSNPTYCRRYKEGQRLGFEEGTFVVNDEATQKPLYLAHHFKYEELKEMLHHVGLHLISFRTTPVVTRSGNRTTGFVAVAS